MKTIKLTFLLFTILSQFIKAQNLDGIYTCNNQKIKIEGSKIEYELISYGDGLHTIFRGSGEIDIRNKRLFIKPYNIKPQINSRLEKIRPSNNDTMFISIHGDEPNQIVVSLYKRKKMAYTTMSNINKKKAEIPRNKIINCDSIYISIVGYKPIGQRINNVNKYDYEIILQAVSNDSFHYEFVTNYEKGFKMKKTSNKICLKYERIINHREKEKWNKFRKMK